MTDSSDLKIENLLIYNHILEKNERKISKRESHLSNRLPRMLIFCRFHLQQGCPLLLHKKLIREFEVYFLKKKKN